MLFLLEVVEASGCYFFENWLMKLKSPNHLKSLATIIQEKYWFFYPSEPFSFDHFNMIHPVLVIRYIFIMYWSKAQGFVFPKLFQIETHSVLIQIYPPKKYSWKIIFDAIFAFFSVLSPLKVETSFCFIDKIKICSCYRSDNFKMPFWRLQCLPKNERKHVTQW